MKGDSIYSYTLRFNKEATPDRQALQNIFQFRDMTHMSIQSAMMFMLAAVDISALHESIVSLTVIQNKKEVPEKRGVQEKPKNIKQAEKHIHEKFKNEPYNENQDENDIDLDDMIADIFDS